MHDTSAIPRSLSIKNNDCSAIIIYLFIIITEKANELSRSRIIYLYRLETHMFGTQSLSLLLPNFFLPLSTLKHVFDSKDEWMR
jgi:hypothetical protein